MTLLHHIILHKVLLCVALLSRLMLAEVGGALALMNDESWHLDPPTFQWELFTHGKLHDWK